MAARKVSLPTHGRAMDLLGPPTVEAMRARLGGRSGPDAHPRLGEVVRLGDGDPPRLGVILADDGEVVDVIAEGGTVRRTAGRQARAWVGDAPKELRAVAADVRAFGALREGTSVTFQERELDTASGTLLEKCRWGALVQRADGAVMGVGFRRLKVIDLPSSPAGDKAR